jgi:RHS repeat-associated protein
VRAVSDKDGKVVESYFYYPFGSGGPVGGLTFTGKELDATGLFYFGARYYDPALGRFITPDPIDVPGQNPYVYCYNNPLAYVDPEGECADPITWAVVAFVLGTTYEYWTFQDDPQLRLDIGIAAAGLVYFGAEILFHPEIYNISFSLKWETPYGVLTIGGVGSYIYDEDTDIGGLDIDITYGIETDYFDYYWGSEYPQVYDGGVNYFVGGVIRGAQIAWKGRKFVGKLLKNVIDKIKGKFTKGGKNVDKIGNVTEKVEKYLGKDYRVITNRKGDKIFLSKDGTRRIRFDMKSTHGDRPHVHLEEKIGGKWRDATNKHRIYPKE